MRRARFPRFRSPLSTSRAAINFSPTGIAAFGMRPQQRSARVGFAYRLLDQTVLRGGWGMYMVPFIIAGNRPGSIQPGYEYCPHPRCRAYLRRQSRQPVPQRRASSSRFPRRLGHLDWPRNSAHFTGGEQRAIPALRDRHAAGITRQMACGRFLRRNHGYDLTTTTNVNFDAVPQQYLSTRPEHDQPVIDLLSANVGESFRGLIPGTGLDGTTTQRQQYCGLSLSSPALSVRPTEARAPIIPASSRPSAASRTASPS